MKKTLLYAFRHSLPILFGFMPVGLAYGLLMEDAGLNFIWTGATSLIVFAGSLQYLMIALYTGGASLLTVALMALLLNSRHIFYGISFIDKFERFGKWKYLLIFTLADEVYSLQCSHHFDKEIDEKWAYIFTGLLPYFYWFGWTVLGALAGSLITFDTTGMDFAMTALFVVILVDQLRDANTYLPALLAAVSSVVSILIFGTDRFILPALCLTTTLLVLFKKKIEPEEQGDSTNE